MKAARTHAVGLLAMAVLWPLGVDAAQILNSSQSDAVARVSGGSVQALAFGGTGVSLGVLDHDWYATQGVETHEVAPTRSVQLMRRPSFPTALGGTLPDLSGIDPLSNEIGRMGSAGITTTRSDQVGTSDPLQWVMVQGTANSSTHEIVTRTVALAGISDKINADESARCSKRAESDAAAAAANAAICEDGYRWGKGWFRRLFSISADTDADLELSESLVVTLDVDTGSDPDVRSAIAGVSVVWAFGLGEVAGESVLLSDSATFEVEAGSDEPIGSLVLTDVLLYDLDFALTAGESYWFQVDTSSYSMMVVPEPSTAALLLSSCLGALLVRRARR